MRPRPTTLALVLALAAAVSACGSDSTGPDGDRAAGNVIGPPDTVSVSTTPHANQAQPLNLDIVYVMKQSLADDLAEMDARQWFDQRQALQAKYGKALKISAWQVPPGIRDALIPSPDESEEAIAGFAFADFASEGTHRIELTGRQQARLIVEEDQFRLEP